LQLCPLPTSLKHQINVSLRGGTTKQSAMLLPMPSANKNERTLINLTKKILLNLTDCFVVPPRNDTLIWCFRDVGNG
jgi:hypothetical protein